MSMPQGQAPQAQQGKAPILECVREGFAFIARDWRLIVPVALTGAVVVTPLEVWSQTLVARSDLAGLLVSSLAMGVLQAPVLAAFFRRAASRGSAPLALRLGADEFNLAAVTLSLAFLFFIVVLAGFFVMGLALASLAMAGGFDVGALQGLPPAEAQKRFVEGIGRDGQIAILCLMAALTVLMLWFSGRLALSYPATVAEGRMQVFSTWRWTRGNATSIVACLLLIAIGALALYMVAMLLPTLLVGALFGQAALTEPGNPGYWLISYLSAAAMFTLVLAPYAAMLAYLYRGLRPQP